MNRVSKFILALIALTLSSAPALAKMAYVSGKAPSYANLLLVMKAQLDPLSRTYRDISQAQVKADGSFRFEVDVDEITLVKLDLSYYEAFIYVEPGAKYVVSLPPRKLKPDAERFNPFYQPRAVNLAIRSSSSNLNVSIRKFEKDFGRLYYPQAVRMVKRHDKVLADNVIAQIDSAARHINCRNPFFLNHVNYRKAEVYATPRLLYGRSVLKKYYAGSPVLFNLPAYWNVLDMINPDVIKENPDKALRAELLKVENSDPTKAAKAYVDILGRDSLFHANVQLREVLVLKNIKDGFYESRLSDGRADSLLTSAARLFKTQRLRVMAANIYARKNKLKAGLPAPEFRLEDNHEKMVSLETFRGKFLYLCFMHTENYECVKVMSILDNMADLHRDDLEILCVFTDDDADAMYAKLDKQKHIWRHISWITSQRILADYEVRGLPTYFLIDPDGCISIAQAPGPTEKIGPAIAECVRKYKVVQSRGRKEVPRTIYDIANGK